MDGSLLRYFVHEGLRFQFNCRRWGSRPRSTRHLGLLKFGGQHRPRLEPCSNFGARLCSIVWILIHHLGDDFNKLFGDVGCKAARVKRSFLEMPTNFLRCVATREWNFATDRVVECAAQGVNIANRSHFQWSSNVLGGQIVRSPDNLSCPRIIHEVGRKTGEPDIGHFRKPLRCDQDVAGFNISVHHSLLVGIFQTQGGLHDDSSGLLLRQRPLGFDQPSQIHARNVLGYQVINLIVASVIRADQIGAVQFRL